MVEAEEADGRCYENGRNRIRLDRRALPEQRLHKPEAEGVNDKAEIFIRAEVH